MSAGFISRGCGVILRLGYVEVVRVKITVNGKPVTISSEPDTPLLWVLREELQLTGTKYGCGIAQCGACTVHVDGRATRSCVTPVSAVANRSVETIEGQAGEQGLTPVQRAWLEVDVAQCGYCQSGQIMAATALLNANPNPSDQEIDTAMAGNICRCGTYPRIRKAVHLAAELIAREQPV